MQTRIVLLSSFRASEARKSLGDEPSKHEVLARKAERATLLNLSAIARQENRKQVALNAVLKCQGMSEAVDHELAMAVSSVLWLQNESIAAIETLRQFLSKNVDVIAEEDQAQLLAQMVCPVWAVMVSAVKHS